MGRAVAAALAPNAGPRAGLAQADEGRANVHRLLGIVTEGDMREEMLLAHYDRLEKEALRNQAERRATLDALIAHDKRENERTHAAIRQALLDLDSGLRQMDDTLDRAYETELTRRLSEQTTALAAIADRLRSLEGLPVRQRKAAVVAPEQAALPV